MTNLTPYNPPQPAVTLVTALSHAQDITDADYADIYARVAQNRSLRNIELALRSEVSYAWWGLYAAGKKQLDRDRKNEIRAWAGLPPLPPTVAEAVTARAHPDAAVYQVGQSPATRVVLVGHDIPSIDLHINSNCALIEPPRSISSIDPSDLPDPTDDPPQESPQPTCNARYARKPTQAIRISPATWQRASQARKSHHLTWDAYLARAEAVDDLVAALVEVDRWLEPDPDALSNPETWGEMERLAVTVRNALDDVRNREQR